MIMPKFIKITIQLPNIFNQTKPGLCTLMGPQPEMVQESVLCSSPLIEQSVWIGFTASNNELEYETLIIGLKKPKILGMKNMVIHCDFQLVAN